MRLTALFPLALSIVAFVLSLLCVLAGRKPGFMEDYHIVALNTSSLGQVLVNTTATSTSAPSPTSTSSGLGSFFSSVTGEIHNITSSIEGDIEGELEKIENDLADDLAKFLGIKEWYSLHMTDMCEGTFSPNATAKGASFNVTDCTKPVGLYHFDPTAKIQSELAKGGVNVSLSDIDYPSEIQHGINDLNVALNAVFVLYCIGIAASGLAILGAAAAFFMWGSRLLSFGNWGLSTVAFLALVIGSSIITVAQTKLANEINKYGNDIGLFADKGHKFTAITWSAVAAMFLASCCWVVEFCFGRMLEKRGNNYTSEKPVRAWRYSGRRSNEAA